IEAHDVATQAMANEARAFARREMIEQGFLIGEVIREPVPAGSPFTLAEASPVGCYDIPLVFERDDQEEKRGADIQPAVQHEQFWRFRFTPSANVIGKSAD